MTLIWGAMLLFILLWVASVFRQTNPAAMAVIIKRILGTAAFGAAGYLLLRGRMDMGLALAGAGFWLFGWAGLPSMARRMKPSPGNVSTVRSARIEMRLDHATGAMDGEVLAGSFAGARLDGLSLPDILQVLRECLADDPDGARLLEAYLDRREPTWRENAQADAHPGPGVERQSGAMTEQEAYEVLGLQPGAAIADIRGAHRALMMRLHPDQGGSTYLAARVNQAKDILLRRHR